MDWLFRHLIVSVMVASVTTMVMYAKPLLWLRRILDRFSRFKGESWGTCGYCLGAPVSMVFVYFCDLHSDCFLASYPFLIEIRNVTLCVGYILSFCFVHFVSTLFHFGYSWMTERVSYPPLEELK